MTDQDRRRTGPIQRRRQQAGGVFRCIQRSPRVEDKAVTSRMLNFNAAPANLARAAVDGKA
jgi:hypothetical protein